MKITITKDERNVLREIASASTKVNGWYAHSDTVRGPFNRWFTCSQVVPEYRKHVSETEDDCKFASSAMNNLVPLLDALDTSDTQIAELTKQATAKNLAIDYLLETIKSLQEVAKFYADPANYDCPCKKPETCKCGELARAVLLQHDRSAWVK